MSLAWLVTRHSLAAIGAIVSLVDNNKINPRKEDYKNDKKNQQNTPMSRLGAKARKYLLSLMGSYNEIRQRVYCVVADTESRCAPSSSSSQDRHEFSQKTWPREDAAVVRQAGRNSKRDKSGYYKSLEIEEEGEQTSSSPKIAPTQFRKGK